MTFAPRSFEVAGQQVGVSGPKDAPLVLLVRLAAREAGLWDGIWAILGREFLVANIDLRAPTVDEMAAPANVLRRMAATCRSVAEALGHPSYHFVGWTGGTQIGLQAAHHDPETLRSLSLLCPIGEAPDMRPVERGLDLIELILRSGRRDLYAYYWYMSGLSDGFIAERYGEVEAHVRRRLAADPFVQLDVDRAMGWMRALRRTWLTPDEMRLIATPTLILAGGLDRWHVGPSRAMAEALAGRLPAAELGLFETMGPLLPLEAPDAVAERVRQFLRRHSSR